MRLLAGCSDLLFSQALMDHLVGGCRTWKQAMRRWQLLAAQHFTLRGTRHIASHARLLPAVQVSGTVGHRLDALQAEVVGPAPPQPGQPA